MSRRRAVADGSVREEAVVAIGPQPGIKCVEPLLSGALNDSTPASLQRTFEKARQHTLERLPLEMIEEHLSHDVLTTLGAVGPFCA